MSAGARSPCQYPCSASTTTAPRSPAKCSSSSTVTARSLSVTRAWPAYCRGLPARGLSTLTHFKQSYFTQAMLVLNSASLLTDALP
jgi:hypothetical protein